MAKTPFGRHLIMIGGNETATFRAGIRVNRNLIIAFVLAGAIAGLAGWLLAIRTSGATANLGVGLLFNAFAAVVIGGVSLKGGVGVAARRLCRRAAAVVDQHGDQSDGPAGQFHPGHPRPAGACRGAARHASSRRSGRGSHDRPAGGQGRAGRRRRARHRQGHRAALRRGRRQAGARRQRGRGRAGDRRRTRRGTSSAPTSRRWPTPRPPWRWPSSATAGSTSSSRTPASIPGS